MLKNVKSVIETSIPQSLLKSPMATSNLDKHSKGATNEHLRKIYSTNSRTHMLKRKGVVKKHNCLNSGAKSEVSLSLPARPSTRRNPSANPEGSFPARSFSMGPFTKAEKLFKFRQKKRSSMTSTRSISNSEDPSENLPLDLQQDIVEGNELETPPNSRGSNLSKDRNISSPQSSCSQASKSSFAAKSSEEHDYLLFLLRITEDIISNDFYSNNDIRRIFRTHVDLNKNRLNMRKMHLHIANLCRELNIDCKEYHVPECVDESDCALKFQNSPRNTHSHTNILNNEAFKSCQDCSAIRTSSVYKIHGTADDNCSLEGSAGDGAVISPSLLRLLDKLSLGRVTECTEPVASTSTMNSPKLNVPNTEEISNTEEPAKSPLDFDTFIKELNSTASVSKDSPNIETDLVSESPSPAINITVLKENHSDETDVPKNSASNLEMRIVPPPDIEVLKRPVHFSKSDTELFSEKEASLSSVSEKYEFEFEKCSSNDSIKTIMNTPEKDASNLVEDNDKSSQVETVHIVETSKSASENKLVEKIKIPVLVKEANISPDVDPRLCLENEKNDVISSKSSITRQKIIELKKVPSNTDLDKFLQKDPLENQENVKELQAESSKSPINLLNDNKETYISVKDVGVMDEKISALECNKNMHTANETNEDNLKNSLKLILQGSVKEEDYVWIKGPVFVYKPLLESEPKLIVFNNVERDEKSRADSPNSQHSHTTFTVDNRHALDQGIQYDTSFHSAEIDRSMDNILQLTKAAYTQFMDMKLLESDYDLTPEKDYSDNKYHYLMADASTSISGINITESLLLNDDYLVKNEASESNVQLDGSTANDIDCYLKRDSQVYENNYVIHKKLVSSVSMPKLKFGGGSRVNSGRGYAGRNENLNTGNILRKCSSDLIAFDVPSQDSSLRSEGEAEQKIQCIKGSMPWNS